MKIAVYALLPLAALAILFGYLTLGDRDATMPRGPTAERTDQREALVERMDKLENQLRFNRIRTQELAEEHESGSLPGGSIPEPDEFPAESEDETESGPPPAEPREVTYQRLQERFARYDETLEAEARDPIWANEMEKTIVEMERAMQDTHLPGTKLISLECRSTLCRAEFEHENRRERNLAPMLIHAEGLPRVSIMRKGDSPTDKQISVAFLAKSDLPNDSAQQAEHE